MSAQAYKVRTPHFPLYSEVRSLLTILQGVPKPTLRAMMKAIWDQTGTPQNPVDWSEPDAWIADRLSGQQAILAHKIWEKSNHSINPRHIYGSYLFINGYGLLATDQLGIYQLTERGKRFLNGDIELIRQLDDDEGIPHLLATLATKTRATRGDLLPEWGDFLRRHSKSSTQATIKSMLRRRLLNLVERGLVSREGNSYVIEPAGIAYAMSHQTIDEGPKADVIRAVSEYNTKQRAVLHKQLSSMDPYRFEHLIRELLEAMGYDNVSVTKVSGDKGVDVVATVQFGITTITEVVQVKRHQANIMRPVLDALRGSLPYHKALRGTLITLGKFSKGCTEAALFPGAAPIGLIDGDKLLELLMEHEIGIRKSPVTLYELDDSFFEPAGEDGEIEGVPVEQDPVQEAVSMVIPDSIG